MNQYLFQLIFYHFRSHKNMNWMLKLNVKAHKIAVSLSIKNFLIFFFYVTLVYHSVFQPFCRRLFQRHAYTMILMVWDTLILKIKEAWIKFKTIGKANLLFGGTRSTLHDTPMFRGWQSLVERILLTLKMYVRKRRRWAEAEKVSSDKN